MKIPKNTPWKVQYYGGTGGIWIVDCTGEKVCLITFSNQDDAMNTAKVIAAAPHLLETTLSLAKIISLE